MYLRSYLSIHWKERCFARSLFVQAFAFIHLLYFLNQLSSGFVCFSFLFLPPSFFWPYTDLNTLERWQMVVRPLSINERIVATDSGFLMSSASESTAKSSRVSLFPLFVSWWKLWDLLLSHWLSSKFHCFLLNRAVVPLRGMRCNWRILKF